MVGIANTASAAQRARWLADLAEALDDARDVLDQLVARDDRFVTVELSARIDAARSEVESLRLKRSPGGGQDFGPEWSNGVPWKLSA